MLLFRRVLAGTNEIFCNPYPYYILIMADRKHSGIVFDIAGENRT
ncbi:hypothetical protein AB434_3322 [Heyndrickxia coagulans]|uniref:Uncharacterized protein n=1 Tax=Heyndrickxia coagulans TaxID=1398 RepID=A0A0C5CN48_HEYCO|nr:hypothetical protein SB48_HM08orf03108 [Heyndrickxia coagulans]AKN55727.1 hypothetical protein AB434_3322 [Heyndrickxia coagulans]KWZ79501.1 hypothetical protein HMPREF3213_02605 [Heyndrickxia coagulans]KYC63994.1 hypothetical protein B4100_3128 [Heyndrickxia coagulans]KYC87207.1 hypothetical protein B4096_3119 [Heyndrickxia coagulans]